MELQLALDLVNIPEAIEPRQRGRTIHRRS